VDSEFGTSVLGMWEWHSLRPRGREGDGPLSTPRSFLELGEYIIPLLWIER
jgi:hypothetical protein